MPYQRYPLVTDQTLVPYHDAFAQTGEEAAQTQAAVLLNIGALLGEWVGESTSGSSAAELFPEEDWATLAIPRSLLKLRKFRGVQLPSGLLREEFGADEAEWLKGARDPRVPGVKQVFIETQVSLSERLARSPEPDAAALLVENSLNHPQSLVRVAAASAGRDLFHQEAIGNELIAVLLEGLDDEDDLVRDLAATILARVDPTNPRLGTLTPQGAQEQPGEPQHTSMLVHGTWARGNSWWQPGGNFHSYILNNVRNDLYSQPDRFDWSGAWSDQARSIAAARLEEWVTAHNLGGLDLICHSHGGSVAMESGKTGLLLNQLVLLSCPVHTEKYLPDFSRVNDVVSVRVKLDLVILADGGGQRYRVDGIRENKLPIWFNHAASHDPDVWRDHDVPSLL